MSKAIIVPDLAYTSPKGRRGDGSNGYKEMLAKLKYFQYVRQEARLPKG